MDAYKLCSADKDLNPKTCKFSLKCKPGMERDEKFLCKKSANAGKAKESLQQRLNSYLKTGQNKTLKINIGQLKKRLDKNGGKNGQGITNSLNRMLEQIQEHQAKNPSKRTLKKKPKPENRMVVRAPSRNSSIYGTSSRSRSRSGSTISSPYSVNLNSVGSVNGQKAHRQKDRKPVMKPLGTKF